MKYVLAVIRIFLFLLVTAVYYGIYLILLLFVRHTDKRGFALRRIFLRTIIPILGFRIRKKLQEVKGPVLFVSNHRGLLDFFVVLRYVNAFVVSKAEVKNIPVFAPAATRTGVIFVDRNDKESRGATRRAIVEVLNKGGNVLIFPEGTTNAARTTMEFKIGAFEEMAKHGIPVVPIALEYKTKRDLWDEGSTWNMFVRQFGKLNTRMKLEFGPVLKSDDPQELMNGAKNWIDQRLLEMQKDWSEVF
jgi:1-acyl-sn-glycerol-3-phosphate acyltransferase